MPLPVILGALAALAGGAGLGRLQAKEAEEMRARETGRDVFLKALLSGVDVPDSILKQYFGNENVPHFKMLGESARANQQRLTSELNSESAGFTPPGTRPNLTPPTPPDQMVPGDPQFVPAWHPPLLLPATPVPSASTSIAPFNFGGQPAAVSQASAASAAPVEPNGGLEPTSPPGAPFMRPRPARNIPLPGGGSYTSPGVTAEAAAESNRKEFNVQQEHAFKRELSTASNTNMPYSELKTRLDRLGLSALSPQTQAALEAYGKGQYEAAQRSVYAETIGKTGRPLTPAETQTVNTLAWLRSGYGPMPAETQETVDQRYIQAMNNGMTNHPDSPFAVLDSVVRGVTGVPSEKAVEQVAAIAKANMERKQALVNPGAHPAATQAAVNESVGFRGVTEAERARAGTPAPLTPEATAGFTSAGQAPPTMAQLGQPGRMSVAEAQRAGEAAKAAAAGAQTKATTIGSVQGKEEATPEMVVRDPAKLEKYVSVSTGEAPAPTTQGDLDEGLKAGKYGMLTTTPEVYRGLKTLKGTIERYREIVNRKDSIFNMTSAQRTALRAASAPMSAEIGGIKMPLSSPPIAFLRKNFTPQQIEDMNEVLSLNNTVAATLRGLGEKGQGISQKLFLRGEEAFPNFLDDGVSANSKVKAMETRANLLMQESVSYPGRVRVRGPKGETGTAPVGQKLDAGWTVIK